MSFKQETMNHEREGFFQSRDMGCEITCRRMLEDLTVATRKGIIETIKAIRAHTGLGLKESKDLAETLRDNFAASKLSSLQYAAAHQAVGERALHDQQMHVVTWFESSDPMARCFPTRAAAESKARQVVEMAPPGDDPGPVRIARVVATVEIERRAKIVPIT